MDALALFCNLHGDGPETLAALREAGCERLAQVADMDPELLGAVLGRDVTGVGRFQREAAVLASRVEGDASTERPADAEAASAPEPEAATESNVLQPAARELRTNDLDRERALLETLEFNPKEVQARTQQIHEQFERTAEQAERVAAQVEEARSAGGTEEGAAPVGGTPKLPRVAQLASPKEPQMGPVAAAVLDLWRSLDQPGEPQAVERQPLPAARPAAESTVDAPLAALAGLGEPVIDALSRIGIDSVGALAAADPLDLTRRTKLPYTHLAHVTFLARRSVAELPQRARELVPEPARVAEPGPAFNDDEAATREADDAAVSTREAGEGGGGAEESPAENARDESPTAEWSEAGLNDERETPPDAGGPFA